MRFPIPEPVKLQARLHPSPPASAHSQGVERDESQVLNLEVKHDKDKGVKVTRTQPAGSGDEPSWGEEVPTLRGG